MNNLNDPYYQVIHLETALSFDREIKICLSDVFNGFEAHCYTRFDDVIEQELVQI